MSSSVLQRNSYGASFNKITIFGDKIQKASMNKYGDTKIKKELRLLLYIQTNKILFPIPQILDVSENSYTMTYMSSYVPVYKIYADLTLSRRKKILCKIFNYLDSLHSYERIPVSKEVYARDLQIETRDKILERILSVQSVLKPYSEIRRVNGIILLTFQEAMDHIQMRIKEHLNTVVDSFYCLVHGDAQFNNILIDPATDELAFIDPRGYYGLSELYGICEYDTAKVLFALTGYDIFDNMVVESLDIRGDEIILPNLFLEPEPLQNVGLVELLTLTIWLGNAHCFIHTPQKAAFSYFYAMYLCSKYLTVKSD